MAILVTGAGGYLGGRITRALREAGAGVIALDRNRADLSVPGKENVYVVGDLSLAMDEHGKPLPGLAQVAKQEGEYLGRALAQKIKRGETPKPFVFHTR